MRNIAVTKIPHSIPCHISIDPHSIHSGSYVLSIANQLDPSYTRINILFHDNATPYFLARKELPDGRHRFSAHTYMEAP